MEQVIELEMNPLRLAEFVSGLYKQGLRYKLEQTSANSYHFTITGY